MTTQEIGKAVDAIIEGDWHEFNEGDLNYEEHVDAKKLARLLRENMLALVSQAYEEAAQKVDELQTYVDNVLCGEGIGPARIGELADDIRAMKDSLAASEVPQ